MPKYIDFDTHVYDPMSVYTDYLDPQYRSQAPFWVEKDGRLLMSLVDKVFPGSPHHPSFARVYGKDSKVDRTGNDPAARLKYMDGAGAADIHVIFPTLGLSGFSGSVRDPKLAAAFSRAYNRYMGEFVSADRRRLRGTMLMPANHPEEAAHEMRWAYENCKLNLVALPPTPPDEIPWSDPSREPIWRTASELNMTILFHETTSGALANSVGINRYGGHWPLLYLCSHVVEVQLAFSDMILGGVLERHPKLRVGAAEAHVQWLPGWLEILDQNFGTGTAIWTDKSGEAKLSMRPSDYFKRQCMLAAFPEDSMIAEVLAVAPESIVVCSDWPHPISAEHSYKGLPGMEQILSPDAVRSVLIDNPARFL
jgi:uncharacterized protein